MKRSRLQIGLTKLEIAGTIVIIAGVVAFLFPIFQRVTEGNHYNNCGSHMKQLGLALIQYTNDADEKMPPGVNALNNGWAGQLYSYVKFTGTYQCPYDKHDDPHFISYAENQRLAGQSVAKFTNPALIVELYEFTTLNCDPSAHESNSATGLTAPQDDPRHDSNTFALNFLAADGHVKYLLPAQVSSGLYAVRPKPVLGGGYVLTFAAN